VGAVRGAWVKKLQGDGWGDREKFTNIEFKAQFLL